MKNLALLALFAVATVSLVIGTQLTGTASAHGILDQANEAGSGGWAFDNSTTGQEFTPSQATVVSVEVRIEVTPGSGAATITLRIRDATIDGAILGSTSELVPAGFDDWQHFDFPAPVALTPGATYVIQAESSIHAMWMRSGDLYPGGRAIDGGEPSSNADLLFRTYSQDGSPEPTPPPTATPTPTSASAPPATPTPPPTATPVVLATTATPAPTPTPAPSPAVLPVSGGAPPDGSSSGLPWLATIACALAVTAASGFWFAYQRRHVR
jgi:hypothetical protein